MEKSCRQMMAKVQRAKQQGQICTIHGFYPFLLAEAPVKEYASEGVGPKTKVARSRLFTLSVTEVGKVDEREPDALTRVDETELDEMGKVDGPELDAVGKLSRTEPDGVEVVVT